MYRIKGKQINETQLQSIFAYVSWHRNRFSDKYNWL